MATLTIRSIDDDLKARLRARAAEHGHSMEAEVREILRAVLAESPPQALGSRIAFRFRDLAGDDIVIERPSDLPRDGLAP